MFDNTDTGMTRKKYIRMKEQLGQEPSEIEMPPDWDDFPEIVHCAINTFNAMGDRIQSYIGYIGKDYTLLPHYIELYNITDEEFFLEILSWLDSRAVKQSSEAMKKQHDKLKRKSRG